MLSRMEAHKVLNCCAGSSSFDSLQMWKVKWCLICRRGDEVLEHDWQSFCQHRGQEKWFLRKYKVMREEFSSQTCYIRKV